MPRIAHAECKCSNAQPISWSAEYHLCDEYVHRAKRTTYWWWPEKGWSTIPEYYAHCMDSITHTNIMRAVFHLPSKSQTYPCKACGSIVRHAWLFGDMVEAM